MLIYRVNEQAHPEFNVKMRKRLTFCATALFVLAASYAVNAALAQSPIREARLQASAFEPGRVRLLDGPFKRATELDRDYLLRLEPDRLLAWFRREAGLEPKRAVYGGWESRGVAGHSLGHYLSASAMMYRATGDERLRERINYIVGELEICQKANGDGYVAAIPEGKRIFAEVARGEIRSQGFDLNGGWVPLYTLHKLFAGLRDAYHLAENAQALIVSKNLADWLDKTLAGLNHEQMQKFLACEHGGMNEVLADLYADTKDRRYLALSRRFHHEAVLNPLSEGRDALRGLHANTQIPKLIGLARRYELTDDATDRRTAEFFWERVVNHHSYVTGGNGLNEHFGPPDKLNDRLGSHTTETCNVYNMLKLTRHLFKWGAEARVADYYERALYNHILSSQHPADGRVIYDLTLSMGGQKEYQTQFDSFTCCVGSGMENHAKYASGIYFYNADSLFVNLFIPSELNWREKNLIVRQETNFPDADSTTLTLTNRRPAALKLRVRHPFWAREGMKIILNGKPFAESSAPSSYFEIARTWKNGDRLEVKLPMKLRLEAMPDNPNRVAVFYGPILLAGDLGAAAGRSSSNQPDLLPALINAGREPAAWLKPVENQPLAFSTVGVVRPNDVTLRPFFRTHDRRYTVYWDMFTPEEWSRKEAEYLAELARTKDLEARTVDFFQPGEMQPERDHNFQGEKTETGAHNDRKWRHATDGGWFSFTLKTLAGAPQKLYLTYWGSDRGGRVFDILVDGRKIATQRLENNRPEKFYEEAYPVPTELTAGKQTITVRIQAHPSHMAGGLYGARLVRD